MVSETPEDLRATLRRLSDVCGRNGEARWAGIVDKALMDADDANLAATVRQWFGGPQGLDRLAITPARGHAVQTCAVDSVNRAVAALRTQAKRLAEALN